MPSPTEVAELIQRAIEELEKRGHTQGRFQDSEGRVCLVGAMHRAAVPNLDPNSRVTLSRLEEDGAWTAAADLVYQIIKEDHPLCISIPGWNDLPGITAEDVILVLKQAKERAITYAILEA